MGHYTYTEIVLMCKFANSIMFLFSSKIRPYTALCMSMCVFVIFSSSDSDARPPRLDHSLYK